MEKTSKTIEPNHYPNIIVFTATNPPKGCFHKPFEHFPGWWLHHPEQPDPVPDYSVGEEIFMNHSPESALAVSQFSSQTKVNLLKNLQWTCHCTYLRKHNHGQFSNSFSFATASHWQRTWSIPQLFQVDVIIPPIWCSQDFLPVFLKHNTISLSQEDCDYLYFNFPSPQTTNIKEECLQSKGMLHSRSKVTGRQGIAGAACNKATGWILTWTEDEWAVEMFFTTDIHQRDPAEKNRSKSLANTVPTNPH